jgi:hypothetical protein
MCGSLRGLHRRCAYRLLEGTDNHAAPSAEPGHSASCRLKRKVLPYHVLAFHHFSGKRAICV